MITISKVFSTYEINVESVRYKLEIFTLDDFFWGNVYREEMFRLNYFNSEEKQSYADELIWVIDYNFSDNEKNKHDSEKKVLASFFDKLKLIYGDDIITRS